MSSSQQMATELNPTKPTRRWRHRTWGRIAFYAMLIMAISLFIWWLPRKESFAIRWAGGKIMCYDDYAVVRDTLDSGWMSQRKWITDQRENLSLWLSWRSDDDAMTSVDVSKSRLNGSDLVRLKQFPALWHVGLHDRHLGPGLDDLTRHLHLVWLSVQSPGDGHLAELLRLPHINHLEIYSPKVGDIGLQSLRRLEHLKHLLITDCEDTANAMQQIQGFTHLDVLAFVRGTGFSDDDLKSLSKLTQLTFFALTDCSLISDVGLDHLSHLEKLEILDLTGSLADLGDEGVQSLGKLKNLTQLIFSKDQISLNQVRTLQRLLPNCSVEARSPQASE